MSGIALLAMGCKETNQTVDTKHTVTIDENQTNKANKSEDKKHDNASSDAKKDKETVDLKTIEAQRITSSTTLSDGVQKALEKITHLKNQAITMEQYYFILDEERNGAIFLRVFEQESNEQEENDEPKQDQKENDQPNKSEQVHLVTIYKYDQALDQLFQRAPMEKEFSLVEQKENTDEN